MNSIIELRDKLDNGSLNTDELFNNSIDMAKKYQKMTKKIGVGRGWAIQIRQFRYI